MENVYANVTSTIWTRGGNVIAGPIIACILVLPHVLLVHFVFVVAVLPPDVQQRRRRIVDLLERTHFFFAVVGSAIARLLKLLSNRVMLEVGWS